MSTSKAHNYDAGHFLASKEASSPNLDDIFKDFEFSVQGSGIHQPFTAIFHRMAGKVPDKIAIECYDKAISYLDLEIKSNQFAAFLTAAKVTEGSILAVALDRSIEMVVAMLGIVKAGCAYLPVDPKLPHERIQYMLEDAQAKAIITSKSVLQEVSCTAEKLDIDTIFPILEEYSDVYVERVEDTSSLAYLLYTSGSTGNPKGVKITHKNLTNLLLSVQQAPGMHMDDRLLAITTISFDIAGIELFLPLITGATVVLANSDAIKDGRLLYKLLQEKQISFMQATPATWRMLTMAGWDKPLPLRILSGGEAFPKDLAMQLMGLCDEVWNGYGPTETTIYSTMKQLAPTDDQITIGKPIDNTGVYILDTEMNPVEEGAVGEIYISGEGVAAGYHGRPELTADRFLPNVLEEAFPIIYKTGDLGCFLPSGEIVCKGRIDHQVKIRGFRIELGEIEQQLLQEPAIKEVAVHTWEDLPGNKRLVAYVVLEDASKADQGLFSKLITAWKDRMMKRLPEYMVPGDWMPLDKLPLTTNQKIDRKALPSPRPVLPGFIDPTQQPTTETERLVHDIWCRSLRMSSVSVDADFFDLGGHSLLAVEVMTAIDRQTGKNVPLTTLFSHATIRKFAAFLDQHSGDASWASLVPIRTNGHLTPLYLVHGMAANAGTFFKLLHRLDDQQPIYGLQSKGLDGTDAPLETVQEMAAHYLREVLEQNPDGPYILGGYSFGGYVAFEMARMLKEMGKEVSQVLMFDTQAVNMPMYHHQHTGSFAALKARLARRKVWIQVMLKAPKTYQKFKKRAAKHKKEKILQKLGLAPAPSKDGRGAVIKRVRAINHQAMVKYDPKPLDVPVIVFKAKIIPSKSSNHWANGWTDYCKDVTVIPVEGDHFTLFEEPFVDDLGKRLRHHLAGY